MAAGSADNEEEAPATPAVRSGRPLPHGPSPSTGAPAAVGEGEGEGAASGAEGVGPSEGESEEEGEGEGQAEAEGEEESEKGEGSEEPPARPSRPPPAPGEGRKAVVRFVLFFMAFLGIYMLLDVSARNSVALTIGLLLSPAIGFGGNHLLVTMFCAAALEMGFSTLAYHFTIDWVESAKLQKHSAAIRPLWMQAVRSQKKDRIEALKPHMDQVNVMQSRVTINQLKGMVITWVLLIAIYTWVGLFIAAQCPAASISSQYLGSAATLGTVVPINASVSAGETPYTYVWWAQSSSTLIGPNTTTAPQWLFHPTEVGAYVITLQVTDARGSIVVLNSASAPVTITDAGSSVALPASQLAVSPSATYVPSTTPPGTTSGGCFATGVTMFGIGTNLLAPLGPVPLWFLAFSLYTVPLNMVFRRYLKHVALSGRLGGLPEEPPPPGAVAAASAGVATP